MEKIRQELHFFGQVQGVGFRYTAKYTASSLGITGWVRNEWDGSVKMEAQGSQIKIKNLIKQLENAPFIEIDRIIKKELPLDDYERTFKVRYE